MTEINHPAYYAGRIEAIDFIEAHGLNFNLGNVIKYVTRAGRKNTESAQEALQKASWYIQREIWRLEREKITDDEIDIIF